MFLHSRIKTYVGKSGDGKPCLPESDVGSLFTETDTGRMYVFNGNEWETIEPFRNYADITTLLMDIRHELKKLNFQMSLMTDVEAEREI